MNSPAYRNDNLEKSLSGYVEFSLTEFPISALLDDNRNPFPLASAIALKFYNDTDEPTDFFYQPYHTSVECFTNRSRFNGSLRLNEGDFPFVIVDNNRSIVERRPYFSENLWDRFTSAYNIDPGESGHSRYRECVERDYPCRYRYSLFINE